MVTLPPTYPAQVLHLTQKDGAKHGPIFFKEPGIGLVMLGNGNTTIPMDMKKNFNFSSFFEGYMWETSNGGVKTHIADRAGSEAIRFF